MKLRKSALLDCFLKCASFLRQDARHPGQGLDVGMFLENRVAEDFKLVAIDLQRTGIKCPEQTHDAQLIGKGLLDGLHLFCGLKAELDLGYLAFLAPERIE